MSPTQRRTTSRPAPPHPGPSNVSEVVDTVLAPGTVVDGFARFSLLGLEIAMVDGPCRIRRIEAERPDDAQVPAGSVEEHAPEEEGDERSS